MVRVPKRLLPVSGTWRVRLVAGARRGARPGLRAGRRSPACRAGGYPRVYNVGFRTARQEPSIFTSSNTAALVAAYQRLAAGTPLLDQLGADGQARFVTGNFWSEDHQADALAAGDVTPFSRRISWRALQRSRSTPEPLVRGTSNRWYVSRLRLGQGVVAQAATDATGDGRPNFLGRIQPYSVYVPRSYRPGRPAPLTWTLHSLSVNHNQYAAYDPILLRRLCEQRGSICAGTLGHGPDGWYFDEAEADYWQVWGALARSYNLDPTATVITGYSMGGWAAYKLGLSHPDLYAEAVALAGPPQCGVSLDADQLVMPAFGGRCTSDGTAYDLVGNARHLPFRIGQGQLDELVPFTSVEQQVQRFDDLGLEHRFVRYPGEDHLVFATQDRFDDRAERSRHPEGRRGPARRRAHLAPPPDPHRPRHRRHHGVLARRPDRARHGPRLGRPRRRDVVRPAGHCRPRRAHRPDAGDLAAAGDPPGPRRAGRRAAADEQADGAGPDQRQVPHRRPAPRRPALRHGRGDLRRPHPRAARRVALGHPLGAGREGHDPAAGLLRRAYFGGIRMPPSRRTVSPFM